MFNLYDQVRNVIIWVNVMKHRIIHDVTTDAFRLGPMFTSDDHLMH